MNDRLWMLSLSPALAATLLIATGLRGLISRRPILYSSRWTVAVMAAMFSPQILASYLFESDSVSRLATAEGANPLRLLHVGVPLVLVFVLVTLWIQLSGYTVLGVTDDSFRSVFQRAMTTLGLRYEERLSTVVIPSEGIEVQITIQSSMGAAQMKPKSSAGRARVKAISRLMAEYFATGDVETNRAGFATYLVMGCFMLAVSGVILSPPRTAPSASPNVSSGASPPASSASQNVSCPPAGQ